MHTTIYLHPKRTLVAQWDTDGEAPVISSYREYAPTADIRSDLRIDATVTVALHASATRWHHFPVDADDDAPVRTAFEISTCLPDIDPTLDRIVAINERTRGTNRQWCALAAIPRTVVDDIAQRIGPEAYIVPDVQCDIHVALTCIAPQPHSWVLMGLRGEMWICAIISPEHTVESIVAFPVDPSISYTENAVECFYGIRSTSEHQVSHVLFFGDELTKSRYEEVASRLGDDSIIIGRLQPFRRVAASVDDATKRSLLALAHLVGPLVAPVLPSFEENESRENP
jgi:hypothetical protein